MITLRPLIDDDLALVNRWPPYPTDCEGVDYALRENGWLAEFHAKPHARCFLAQEGGEPLGFAILAKTAEDEAEFRIALRADKIGQGHGGPIAAAVLEQAFSDPALARIHLIVRKNNQRAIRLYWRLGFVADEECVLEIQGGPVAFLKMAISREDRRARAALRP